MAARKITYKDEQKKFRLLASPKLIPRGEKVTIMGWDAKKKKYVEKELPNAEGSHYTMAGARMVKVNRHRYHQRVVDRSATKSGRFIVTIAEKDNKPLRRKDGKIIKHRTPRHKVNPHVHELPYAPSLTNHQRMKLREEERNAKKAVPAS